MGSAALGFWGLGRAIWPSGRKLEGGQGQAKAAGPLGWGSTGGPLIAALNYASIQPGSVVLDK